MPEHDVQADKAVLRMIESSRHCADDLESERLPEVHCAAIRLDHRVELDALEAGGTRPVEHVLAERAAGTVPW